LNVNFTVPFGDGAAVIDVVCPLLADGFESGGIEGWGDCSGCS
jgi:hypothetical protein